MFCLEMCDELFHTDVSASMVCLQQSCIFEEFSRHSDLKKHPKNLVNTMRPFQKYTTPSFY